MLSCDLKADSLSMSNGQREVVPDASTNERKGALSLELPASVRNTEDAIISRRAEST